jgi:hypothetical protein
MYEHNINAYLCTYIHTYTFIHKPQVWLRRESTKHTFVHTHINIYIHIHTQTAGLAQTGEHQKHGTVRFLSLFVCVSVFVSVFVCVCVFVCVSTFLCLSVLSLSLSLSFSLSMCMGTLDTYIRQTSHEHERKASTQNVLYVCACIHVCVCMLMCAFVTHIRAMACTSVHVYMRHVRTRMSIKHTRRI